MRTPNLEPLGQKYRLKPGPCNYYMKWGSLVGLSPSAVCCGACTSSGWIYCLIHTGIIRRTGVEQPGVCLRRKSEPCLEK